MIDATGRRWRATGRDREGDAPSSATGRLVPWSRGILFLLLGAALLVGIAARLSILADRPLAVDEYYTVTSVEFILDRGLPAFPSGGYYTRGLPYQYMLAAVAAAFGESAFNYRLISFGFSLLSIWLAYVYARRFVPAAVAIAVATALLVSSWHIEFAGFIRMYALFQCLTLIFLIAVDDAFFRGGWQRRYLPHALLLLATLSHELGITLVPLLFLPLVAGGPPGGFRGLWAPLRFTAVGLATAVLAVAFVFGDLRDLGVVDPFPPGYAPSGDGTGPFTLPVFPFPADRAMAVGVLVLVSVLLVGGIVAAWRRRLAPVDVWLAGLLVATAAHLFLVSALVLAVLVFRFDLHRPALHPAWRYGVVLAAALLGIAWLGYAALDPAALLADPEIAGRWDLGEAGMLKALWTTFLGWPDLHRGTLYPFAAEMPLLGLSLALALVIVLVANRHAPLAELLRQPWVVIVVTALIYGVVQGHYSRLRYFYHLLPVILCLVGLALTVVATRLAAARPALRPHTDSLAAFGFLSLFALLSDFSPAHLANIRDDAVTFRMAPFEDHLLTWYTRLDFETPATFVNAQPLDDTDRVVVEYHFPISRELQAPHAIYIPRAWGDVFSLHSRNGGTLDLWADRPLLSTPEELAAYTRSATDVWLLRGVDRGRDGLPSLREVWGDRLLGETQAFVSRDARLEVLHVRLRPADEAAGSR